MPGAAARRPGGGDQPIRVDLGPYRVSIATSYGPRVAGLRLIDGPEMFAELPPEIFIDRPDSGTFRFHGGHRLWASPEVPAITYAPDEHPCDVARGTGKVSIKGPADGAGLSKTIALRHENGSLTVDHTLTNDGPDTLEVGPWAITQVPLGGAALVPTGAPGPEGLQASHSLVLWPYTDLSDRRLTWLERALIIAAAPGGRLKMGAGPAPGRLGYLRDGHLFTKVVPPAGPGAYADRGAVAQVFVNESFCELESLGPVMALSPGRAVSHRETWAIAPCDGLETAYRRVVGEQLR